MNITFSKFYLSEYETEQHVIYKGLRLYYVFIENHLLNHYLRHGSKHFFKLKEKEIEIINTNKGLFKTPEYSIFDKQINKSIGSFIIPPYYNDTYSHYPDVPYTNPYLKISLNSIEYEVRREKPESEYHLFDSRTWGRYEFCIYDEYRNCKVRYNFKIVNPLLDTSIILNNELEGKIEVEPENYLLMFSGFFLLEYFFDSKSDNG